LLIRNGFRGVGEGVEAQFSLPHFQPKPNPFVQILDRKKSEAVTRERERFFLSVGGKTSPWETVFSFRSPVSLSGGDTLGGNPSFFFCILIDLHTEKGGKKKIYHIHKKNFFKISRVLFPVRVVGVLDGLKRECRGMTKGLNEQKRINGQNSSFREELFDAQGWSFAGSSQRPQRGGEPSHKALVDGVGDCPWANDYWAHQGGGVRASRFFAFGVSNHFRFFSPTYHGGQKNNYLFLKLASNTTCAADKPGGKVVKQPRTKKTQRPPQVCNVINGGAGKGEVLTAPLSFPFPSSPPLTSFSISPCSFPHLLPIPYSLFMFLL